MNNNSMNCTESSVTPTFFNFSVPQSLPNFNKFGAINDATMIEAPSFISQTNYEPITPSKPSNTPSSIPPSISSSYTLVKIDVGGMIYTTSLETLTKYPDSKIAKISNSLVSISKSVPPEIFIDRDGGMFRYILSFLRSSKLLIDDNFSDLELLLEEARFFKIKPMIAELENVRKLRVQNRNRLVAPPTLPAHQMLGALTNTTDYKHEVVTLNTNCLFERDTLVCAEGSLIKELFPNESEYFLKHPNLFDRRKEIRFYLHQLCQLNSIEILSRFLNAGFTIAESTGFENAYAYYILVRRTPIAYKK